MEGLGVFVLIIIPASIFFIFLTTRGPDSPEDNEHQKQN